MILEIVSVSEVKHSEKRGKNYKTLKVKKNVITRFTNPDGSPGFAKGAPKIGTINVWEDPWDNGVNDFGYDEVVGTNLVGDIVTRVVPEYMIEGNSNPVNTRSITVLGDVDDPAFEIAVDKEFQRAEDQAIATGEAVIS